MLQRRVQEQVGQAMREAGYEVPSFTLSYPDEMHGDIATNVAFLIRNTTEGARAVAERIALQINEQRSTDLERVEVAGSGFINFFFTEHAFMEELDSILSHDSCCEPILHDRHVLVEHTDPNPFKEFHAGHLMPNAIGESLAALAEGLGAQVTRVCYQGDVGLHIAKALFGLQQMIQEGAATDTFDASVLGKAYARGAQLYEDARDEVHAINRKLYGGMDDELQALYNRGREISLQQFEKIYARLGTRFDTYFFESVVAPIGEKVVRDGIAQGVFEEDDGAVIFRGEQSGLHTRVFITQAGIPTYEAKELGLALEKEKQLPHDLSLVVTADETREYMRVVRAALERLHPSVTEKMEHITHGLLRFHDRKMSSRTGDVVPAESVLDDLVDRIRERQGKDVSLSPEELDIVAVAALRYVLLSQTRGQDVVFNPDIALSLEGDSGPYLLYTRVRMRALYRKAGWQPVTAPRYYHKPLVRLLSHFESVVYRAWETRESHHIAQYGVRLAHAFNTWYAVEPILGQPDTEARLGLVHTCDRILTSCLTFLAIRTVEHM